MVKPEWVFMQQRGGNGDRVVRALTHRPAVTVDEGSEAHVNSEAIHLHSLAAARRRPFKGQGLGDAFDGWCGAAR